MRRGSGMRYAWPVAVSGFLPPFCGMPPWHDGSGGAAGSAGTAGISGDTGAGAAAGSAGESASSGGAGADGGPAAVREPVLGCKAGVWPDLASFEELPLAGEIAYYPPPRVTGLSANGEVPLGYTHEYEDIQNPETSDVIRHPAVLDWAWQVLVPGARQPKYDPVVNCDGSVVAGVYDDWLGFIKRTGKDPVILVGRDELEVVPHAISADGTRVVGNLYGEPPFPQELVLWTERGDARYLSPAEPRTGWHLTYDGSSIAGHTDRCLYFTHCGVPEDLRIFAARPNAPATIYPAAPYALMSSDGSTFADARGSHEFDEFDSVVHLFRPASGLTVLPCPNSACAVVDLSSRGRILLVNSGTPYLWTERHGFRNVADILAEDGIAPPLYFSAVAMSDDGRVIVGQMSDGSSDRFNYRPIRIVLPRKAYD